MEIPSSYDPKNTEDKWFAFWSEKDYFRADEKSKKPPFALVMPPPNVTGILHMGHVLGSTLQDILARYKRMMGFEVLWLPGTDHAGIATQTVVERDLINREGKRRRDIGRVEFEKLCHDWSEHHQKNIVDQIKKIGSSCDYSRQTFTMDKSINKSVLTLFKKLFDEKLIYRGKYLVNWDPLTQTALADDEVEHEEKKSSLWYITYPLVDGSDKIIIATTRPETLLGDTAVAVSAKDKRYKHLIGKKILLPLTNREIPIIADPHANPEFGTGALKITPAHDFNDYEVGLRNQLPMINIMTSDGKINENGGVFEGLTMKEAREAVVKNLKEVGALVKIEPHIHKVGTSYRSKAVIEPYLSEQWFIKMKPFAEKLKKAVKSGGVKLHPKTWENTYFHWIDNLRDWCISRQLWWGHRIPIWYHKDNPKKMICHTGDDLPEEVKKKPENWTQEEDVLDTWFSSALWPFSTLGWPEKTYELDKFYPNQVLITGHDILFFWVARMLMMGEYSLKKLPFPDVILTGLIYGRSYWRKNSNGGIHYVNPEERIAYDLGKEPPKDVYSKWEKISKSKGNAIDPREIIDQYGTCAMRLALASTSCQLQQIDLDRRRFEEYKNFTNKIWNGARFVITHIATIDAQVLKNGMDLKKLALEDEWILSKLCSAIDFINEALSKYQFDHAAQKVYDFFWNEFCAYYLEISKPYLFEKLGDKKDKGNKQLILFIVLLASVRLMHPMAPFITEELFQILKKLIPVDALDKTDFFTEEAIKALKCESCMIAPYPHHWQKKLSKNKSEDDFSTLQQIIYTIRNIRGEMKVGPGIKTDVYFEGSLSALVKKHASILQALLPIQSLYFDQKTKDAFSCSSSFQKMHISIPLPRGLLSAERERLQKEEKKKLQNLEHLKNKINNPNFIERAPKKLVDEQKQLLQNTTQELDQIQNKLKELSS